MTIRERLACAVFWMFLKLAPADLVDHVAEALKAYRDNGGNERAK